MSYPHRMLLLPDVRDRRPVSQQHEWVGTNPKVVDSTEG